MNNDLDKIPVIKLAHLPTPLDEVPRLGRKAGISRLLIKRDDLTGFAGGGNKARKLEYDFAEIKSSGCDVVITAGGIQSNHARMTAAAARKLDLDVKLVLGGPDFNQPKGNLLLDAVFNSEIRYLVDDDANESLTNEMNNWAEELTAEGKKPYVLPIGGSTGLGALGYVKAMEELSRQFGQGKVQIITAVGSCGTFAGIILGAKLFMPEAEVIGISVSRTNDAIRKRTPEIIKQSAGIINYRINTEGLKITCYDNYYEEYGIMTDSGRHAIHDCANLEGILLDPIYTGKAMAGLLDLADKNIINKNVPVIFIHTGGTPIIFSFENELGKNLNIRRIINSH